MYGGHRYGGGNHGGYGGDNERCGGRRPRRNPMFDSHSSELSGTQSDEDMYARNIRNPGGGMIGRDMRGDNIGGYRGGEIIGGIRTRRIYEGHPGDRIPRPEFSSSSSSSSTTSSEEEEEDNVDDPTRDLRGREHPVGPQYPAVRIGRSVWETQRNWDSDMDALLRTTYGDERANFFARTTRYMRGNEEPLGGVWSEAVGDFVPGDGGIMMVRRGPQPGWRDSTGAPVSGLMGRGMRGGGYGGISRGGRHGDHAGPRAAGAPSFAEGSDSDTDNLGSRSAGLGVGGHRPRDPRRRH
ncbi:MAG: hypothetical protein M1836_004761 [Candelina mexicana]|nr:MAG: hypothetical protein M1836_004761 [Candelina mexicana]